MKLHWVACYVNRDEAVEQILKVREITIIKKYGMANKER